MSGVGRDVKRSVLFAVLGALLALAVLAGSARAGVVNAGIPGAPAGNPLAGLPWGVYTGPIDGVYTAYQDARGAERQLLARVALQPRALWFGSWYSDSAAQGAAQTWIHDTTHGRADVMAQVAIFRMDPWEEPACHRLPTPAQQAGYRRWIDGFAAGIGSARVALILQPDLPFAFCVPHHSKLPLRLVAYAARTFSALPHTTVYLDAGSSDWESVPQAVTMLRGGGERYARGFALNATHYDSTAREILFGQKVTRALAAAHLPGRHFVIDTAENGRPFTFQQFHGHDFNNAPVCRTRASRRCVALGIPPTWHVADRRWGLAPRVRRIAARLVDGYLWFGRPWLDGQSNPFDLRRTLGLAATWPFA